MKNVLFMLILLTGLFTAGQNSSAQLFRSGPQVATFYSEIDDSEQPYGLVIPPYYDPQKSYPLVIMLHGATSNHRLALRRVFGKPNRPGENDALASRYFPEWKDPGYFVATPYARGTMGYMGIPEADVMQVIEECKTNFNIDENRVYLTGLSMGGGGTLYIGLTHPDVFAAIAPVCPAPPEEVWDLMGNALNLPVLIFQGGADAVVKPEGVRTIADELRKLDTSAEYHEYPGVQHNVWVQAYQDLNIFDWFNGHLRDPFPQRVRYSSKWYRYDHAYWVIIDKMIPGTLAAIDAKFTSLNNVEIKTENLEAFTLRLKGHPSFQPAQPLTVRINGIPVRSSPVNNHSFMMKDGNWTTGVYRAPVTAKKRGLEGPLYEVLTSRVVFVYGTEGASGTPEIAERKLVAKQAADFSVSFGNAYEQPSHINPRIIPDKEVTEEDYLSSNLFLIGTNETNTVIAELADKLPLHLGKETSTYGLVYCYPVNGKMAVVASGIPFWTKAHIQPGETPPTAPANRARTRISFGTGPGAKALAGRKDFLLFKETNDQVISEGYFDNAWKLPADALQKMKASGVVEVK